MEHNLPVDVSQVINRVE